MSSARPASMQELEELLLLLQDGCAADAVQAGSFLQFFVRDVGYGFGQNWERFGTGSTLSQRHSVFSSGWRDGGRLGRVLR